MWNTLRTLVNRTGLTFNALKTSVFFAEDYNKVTENLDYLKERSDIVDTLAGGTETQILTKDSGTDFDFSWQDAPAGGGGGQALYDCIVDASGGGDYTDLKEALDAGHRNIFLKNGTYTFTATYTFPTYTNIVGEDKALTIITSTASTAFKHSTYNHFTNVEFRSDYTEGTPNLFWDAASSPYYIYFDNCRFTDDGAGATKVGNFIYLAIRDSYYRNCYFSNAKGIASTNFVRFQTSALNVEFSNNIFDINVTANASIYAFQMYGQYFKFNYNNILTIQGQKILDFSNSDSASQIMGNYFRGGTSATVNLITLNGQVSFINNYFHKEPTAPIINLTGDNNVVTGNVFRTATGSGAMINIASGSDENIVSFNTATVGTGTPLTDAGSANITTNNINI
jgi:hypothetical protein